MSSRILHISPSILSADLCNLQLELKALEDAGADLIHCDIMDGHFVPNITFGPAMVEAVKKAVSIPLDVHLMISDPLPFIDPFCRAGADILTFHAETTNDVPRVVQKIKSHSVRAGVTVNPDKDVSLFLPHLAMFDQALIMTVFAGFSGQKFMPETVSKIRAVSAEARRIGHDIDIEVDGGITDENIGICAAQGANVFVAGSYVFRSRDYRTQIETLRNGAALGQKSLMQE